MTKTRYLLLLIMMTVSLCSTAQSEDNDRGLTVSGNVQDADLKEPMVQATVQLFRKPDHFENYDDWPFLWGQNEGTIAGNTQYIIFGSSFKNIVTE